MQKPLFLVAMLLLSITCSAQLTAIEEESLLKVLLSDFTYNNKTSEFSTDGILLKQPIVEYLAAENKTFAVVWLQADESPDRFNQVTVYEYGVAKKGFIKINQLKLRDERTWMMEATIRTLGEKEVIEVTSGYDSDGDGDEIKYYLVLPTEDSIEVILEHMMRSDSGDGCDGEDVESTINVTDELIDGFPNIEIEETNSTFNHCDENAEESCTRKLKYQYVWNGQAYDRQ